MAKVPNAKDEMDKVEKQFDEFDKQVKDLTLDRMNAAPKEDTEQQTKLSSNQISNSKDVYLKPHKTIGCRDKFNEDYRKNYNFAKEYVHFVAENKEIIGETIDIWTRPFAGMPAEWWKVPVNTPIWGPRYLAEQIKSCSYHRLTMDQSKQTNTTAEGQYFGQMVVDTTVQRLDAIPASKRKSIFMGAEAF